jgi:fatty-acyl-CoA synthase
VPEQPAASLDERVLGWRELDRAGNRAAHALRALGVGHRDRVVVWADTALEVLPVFVALAKLGAVFAPLNARLGAAEAAAVAQLARPRLLLTAAARAGDAPALARAAGVPAHATLALPHTRDDDVTEPALHEDDPHVLFFTSGSTGRPKGVVLSHRANWLRSFQGVFRDEPERSVCMFPLFHMAAFTLALAAWQTRGEIAFVRSPTPEALLAAVERRRANRLYCIPLVWARILAADVGRYDLASLRELDTGTSATPPELIHALKQRFPWTRTRIYYGSTEAGSVATLPDAEVLAKPGSVGRASPGVELRLSEAGEICARSPFLMDGYFDDTDATAAALRDGWYHTGDLGALDADGCLSIVGRMKDVIRTGGESVSPAEVEAALVGCGGVREVAVVGVPDPEWGELVCAVVVPEPGAALTLDGLRAHCEGRIAGFKRPRRLVELAALPRTAATGQIQRALLIERITSGS